jgi:MFS family permease
MARLQLSPQPHMATPAQQSKNRATLALVLLLAINLFNYIDRYILAAVEPLISEHFFAASDETAMAKTGSLATAFLLSYMVLAPFFGSLADRVSRWMIIGIGVGVWSLATGWSGMAQTFTMLMISRIFVGVGEAAYGPSAPTIISDLYPIERRGMMLSYFYLAIPVGSALGYSIGGWLSGKPDPGATGLSALGHAIGSSLSKEDRWRAPFYAMVLPGILLATFCFFLRDPRKARAAEEAKPKLKLADVLTLFRIKSYVLNTAAMTAMTFAIGGIAFWLPRYLYHDRAADFGGQPDLGRINFNFGAITAVAGLSATLIGGWCGDRVRKKVGSAYFLVSGLAMLLAFPVTVFMLKTHFPEAWAFVFLAEFFLFFNTGPANTALANVVPPSIRSTAFALNIFVIHALGDAISPPLIGWIAGQTSMNFAFIIVSATMVVASAFWLIGTKYLARDTEAVERVAATTEAAS